jgi:hypothetical protein
MSTIQNGMILPYVSRKRVRWPNNGNVTGTRTVERYINVTPNTRSSGIRELLARRADINRHLGESPAPRSVINLTRRYPERGGSRGVTRRRGRHRAKPRRPSTG